MEKYDFRRYRVEARGVEVTSGADFPKGRSANVEMCSLIAELAGCGISASYIRGGDVVSNVPGFCEAVFDVPYSCDILFRNKISERTANPFIEGAGISAEEILL